MIPKWQCHLQREKVHSLCLSNSSKSYHSVLRYVAFKFMNKDKLINDLVEEHGSRGKEGFKDQGGGTVKDERHNLYTSRMVESRKALIVYSWITSEYPNVETCLLLCCI